MHISSWLDSVRNRIRVSQRRRPIRTVRASSEILEDRTLLSVSGLFIAGELNVISDAGDDILIRQDPASPNNIQVLANLVPVTTLPPTRLDAVTTIIVRGGDAANSIDLSLLSEALYNSLAITPPSILIEGNDGDDTIIGATNLDEVIRGGDGNDLIFGVGSETTLTLEGDTLDGGDGNDSVLAQLGNDVLIGGNGQDTLEGFDGNDTITGGNGIDVIMGQAGDDSIDAGSGADVINGNDGNDFINGGSGADMLMGDGGNDNILGGSNADVILGGDGDDILDGQAANDTINGEDGDDMLFGGTEDDSLLGNAGDDLVNGNSGNDLLIGNSGNDIVLGGSGNDLIYGDSDDPTVFGPTSGNDFVKGHSGNDTIFGGGGADYLDGGNGNDLIQSNVSDLLIGDIVVTPEGASGTRLAVFTVSLSRASGTTVTVDYATAAGTATAGVDYQSTSGMLTFQPGVTEQTITVLVNGDRVGENDETFFVNLTNATNAAVIDNQGQATILDDDVAIVVDDIGIGPEGPMGMQTVMFTVSLTRPSVNTVTVNYTTADGTATGGPGPGIGIDYQTVAGSLTFMPGQTTQMVSVDVFGDLVIEADETILFNLSSGMNADIIDAQGVGTIFNDDVIQNIFFDDFDGGQFTFPGITSTLGGVTTTVGVQTYATVGFSGNFIRNGGTSTTTLTLTGLPLHDSLDLNFLLAIIDTWDGGSAAGQTGGGTTFPDFYNVTVDGMTVFQQSIDQEIPGDAYTAPPGVLLEQNVNNLFNSGSAELDSAYDMGLEPVFNAFPHSGSTLTISWFASGVGVQAISDESWGIEDVEVILNYSVLPIALTVDDITLNPEGDSGISPVDFTVSLNQLSMMPVTVDFATADGTATAGLDYQPISGTLTFAPGVTTQIVTVNTIRDLVKGEGAHPFFLNLSNPMGARIDDPQGSATIIDDDGPAPSDEAGDTLVGGAGFDTLLAADGDDVLNGGADDDTMDGNGGNDTLFGGAGNDTLDGGANNDLLDGQSGNDTVRGGSGDDTYVWGGATDDSDVFSTTTGADTVMVQGNGGANMFSVDQVDSQLQVHDGTEFITVGSSIVHVVVNGGSGADTITVGDLSGVAPLELELQGGAGNDTITAAGATFGDLIVHFDGGTGNDIITGSNEADTIVGGDGDDQVFGGLGNDTLIGGLGNDMLDGQDGDDSLTGNDGDDVLLGNAGNDTLQGNANNDNLNGGIGDDLLEGNDGRDTLNGTSGNDMLRGGNGQDTLFGGSGADTLDGGNSNDSLKGHSGNDLLIGGEGNDTLKADAGDDTLCGGNGNDVIRAGAGNDLMSGEDGDDFINGEAGDDTMTGGDGDDNMLGGGGRDLMLGQNGDDRLRGQGSTDTLSGGEGLNDIIETTEVDEGFVLSQAIMDALDVC